MRGGATMAAIYDRVIRGGRVVGAEGVARVDLALRDGRIAAIGADLSAGTDEIDAAGCYVMPGGVDPHAHIEQISGMGQANADTFETATRAAALGGTTSVVSFAAQQKGRRLSAAVADYAARARRGALIDYAFHLSLSDTGAPDFEADLARLIGEGHRSVKIFTTYDIALSDREIAQVIALARRQGALVCVHAENDGLIGWARDALLAAGLRAPKYHAPSHPRLAEIEAVERLCRFAEFFAHPVMLFHISARESLEAIAAARARGVPVRAETCPQYLFQTADILDRPGLEGAKWMCSPPQRSKADQEALWAGLMRGDLDLVSSDHAPYRFDETGKLSAGPQAGFDRIANGQPGLETRLPLLFDAMVVRGWLGPEAFVRLTATAPARIYGLAGKGRLAPGMDGDVVVWDPAVTRRYGRADLHDNTGYNPWAGREIRGWPRLVFSRGEKIVEDGVLRAAPGRGRWLERGEIGVRAGIAPAEELRIIEGAGR